MRQSEGFLLARMSDVTHHLMRRYDNPSAHNIPTSKHNSKAQYQIPSYITILNPYLLHMHTIHIGITTRYAFCMVFHVRWIFLTTNLRIPPESRFGDEWWKIHLIWKIIQNAFSRILYTLMHFNIMRNVADHENHVRWVYLTTVLCMGKCQKYARIQNTL